MKLTDEMHGAIEEALEADGWAQINVFLAGYRMGQRDMRERLAKWHGEFAATNERLGDLDRASWHNRAVAAIRNLSVEES